MNDLPLAVLYLRMSTDKQDTSIQAQRDRVYPFFAGKYKIVAEYVDEGKSGSKDTEKRTDFLRMVKDLTIGKWKGRVKVALCLDLSRFGRLDTIEGADEKKQLRKSGVKLDTVIDGLIDWNTATGRIVDSVKSEGNHQLSLLIAEKGLAGRIKVTQQGIPNQTTPYGMAKRVTAPTGETLIVKRGQKFAKPKSWGSEFIPGDPDEMAAVRFMFETFDREDISYRELTNRLQAEGFPSPRGRSRSEKATINGWRADTVQYMLRNPVYVGDLRIGENPKGEFFQVYQGQEKAAYDIQGVADPIIKRDAHTGIIDRTLFDRVQEKYQRNLDRDNRKPPRRAGPYTLTGIIRCGNCKNPMYGMKADYGDRNRNIYLCQRGQMNAACDCGSWIAYENQILPLITRNFFGAITRELQALEPDRPEAEEDGRRLQRRLAALDGTLATARENFFLASKATAPGLMARLEEMEAERVDLVARLKGLKGRRGNQALEWWRAFQREFFAGMPVAELFLPPHHGKHDRQPPAPLPETLGESVQVVLDVPPAVLRERLLKLDLQVFVWFERKAKGEGMGWKPSKIRITANVGKDLVFDYSPAPHEGDDESDGCPGNGVKVVAGGNRGYAGSSKAAS